MLHNFCRKFDPFIIESLSLTGKIGNGSVKIQKNSFSSFFQFPAQNSMVPIIKYLFIIPIYCQKNMCILYIKFWPFLADIYKRYPPLRRPGEGDRKQPDESVLWRKSGPRPPGTAGGGAESQLPRPHQAAPGGREGPAPWGWAGRRRHHPWKVRYFT